MAWNYGNTVDTLVGGFVTIKVMETGMKMIDYASTIGRKKTKKKQTGFHGFGSGLF